MEIVMHNNADGLISLSIANQIAETSAFIISEDIDLRKKYTSKLRKYIVNALLQCTVAAII